MRIIHVPRAVTKQRGWRPTKAETDQAILEIAELVSQQQFGKPMHKLSYDQKDALVDILARLWSERES
jgi:hypothetical protein